MPVTSRQLLKQWIADQDGFLPLQIFMEKALYDPDHGYYTRHIKGVGPGGDFSTSTTLSQLLGRAIAQWAATAAEDSFRFRWNLIEIGGGCGDLASSVLTNLPWRRRLGARFHLTELSPKLREAQADRLRGHFVHWHTDLEEALASASGNAILYSNELLDAFPCMQFEFTGGSWETVGLALNVAGEVIESTRSPSGEEADALDFMNIDPAWEKPGRRLEIQWSIRNWIKKWSPAMQRGTFLAIDYGEVGSVLPRRYPFGSLRAYFQHQVLEGEELYRRVGRQDLTVDVNFSHLRRWMEDAGWEMTEYMEQRDFMLQHVRRNWSLLSPVERQLMDELGAGGAFKVSIFRYLPS